MKTFKFEKVEHPEYGEYGWRMINTNMDPLGGMGVAHDCLEHFGESDVTLSSELVALGASLFTRQDYYSAKGKFYTDPGKHVSSDLVEIMNCVARGENIVTPSKTYRDSGCDDQITIALLECTKELREDVCMAEALTLLHVESNKIRSWLRIGYRKAKLRYRGHSNWDVTNLFMQIEDTADKYLRSAEVFEQLVVRVNYKGLTADIRLCDEEIL